MDIDNISEDDLLSALGDLSIGDSSLEKEEISLPAMGMESEFNNEPLETLNNAAVSSKTSTIDINSESFDSVAMLLKELLNNKTIEITIKIKD